MPEPLELPALTCRGPNWRSTAAFYDRSHLANEFRAFSGIDATTYTARRTRWTGHVVAD